MVVAVALAPELHLTASTVFARGSANRFVTVRFAAMMVAVEAAAIVSLAIAALPEPAVLLNVTDWSVAAMAVAETAVHVPRDRPVTKGSVKAAD